MLFQKRWVSCLSNGSRIRRPIFQILPSELGYDAHGRFYMSHWFPQISGQTPKERQLEIRDPEKEKIWIQYPDGLGSILRGVTLAIVSGKSRRLPQIAEIQTICSEFRAELTLANPEIQDIKAFKSALRQAAAALANAKKPELKEAREKLIFILPLRDSQGRFNVGMIAARLTAVIDRLVERLTGIYAWLPRFLGRQEALENLRQWIQNAISDLNRHLKAGCLIWPPALNFLFSIRPFIYWARNARADLKQAEKFFTEQKPNQAQICINRVLQAIKIAGAIFRLEDLLEEYDFDLLQKRSRPAYYQKRIEQIGNWLKTIDESDFRGPVCKKALGCLRAAYRSLNSTKPRPKKSLKAAIAALAGE